MKKYEYNTETKPRLRKVIMRQPVSHNQTIGNKLYTSFNIA